MDPDGDEVSDRASLGPAGDERDFVTPRSVREIARDGGIGTQHPSAHAVAGSGTVAADDSGDSATAQTARWATAPRGTPMQ